MGQVNGRGRFSTLHSSETPRPIITKLEIYNYFPDTAPHAKFQGPMSTGTVWANSQFDDWKFLSFPFLVTPTGRIFGHMPTLNTSLCVIPAKEVPFYGLERLNLKFDPFYPQKRKIWDGKSYHVHTWKLTWGRPPQRVEHKMVSMATPVA